MKFFSNEKESTDEDRDRADVVTSDPVPVPQQRAGSPWTDAPGRADDELADRERRDGTEEAESRVAEDRDRPEEGQGRPEEDQSRVEEDQARVDDAARPEVPGDDTARPEVPGDDTARSAAPGDDTAWSETPARDSVQPKVEAAGDAPDAPTWTATEPKSDDNAAAQVAAVPVTAAEDTATDRNATGENAASDVDAAPDVAAIPAETVSATAATPAPDRLFTDGDSFADRFREIQLRFVDDPKQATAEAATLVGEAVDTLTSTLKGQQDRLTSGSDDTEQLRVELRGYRDLMNRLLAL